MSTSKTMTMTSSKIRAMMIKISKSVVAMTTMLIARFISFTLLKSTFWNRNDELWIASSFNTSLRIKMRLSNIALWISQLITFARLKTLMNRKSLSTLKKYVLLSIWEVEKKRSSLITLFIFQNCLSISYRKNNLYISTFRWSLFFLISRLTFATSSFVWKIIIFFIFACERNANRRWFHSISNYR